MRHYEDFEVEHLLHRTGGFWLRLRVKLHLRRCAICRERYRQLQRDAEFMRDVRAKLTILEQAKKESRKDDTQ